MPELLLELFSEEIPARMQARGAEELSRAFAAAAAPVLEGAPRVFHGARRIGLVAMLRESVTTEGKEERGPRVGAPDAALEGFCRKHGVERDALEQAGGFWVLRKAGETVTARDLLARALPGVVRGVGWPKSMRWDGPFTWVRPLRRILCVLDGEIVPFGLEELPGLVSGNETEGHRIMAPGAFVVRSFAEYEAGLRERRLILDAAERMRVIEEGLARLAAAKGLRVVPDRGLLEEVAGLVEWPLPLLGRIDDAFMDLPPEVMRTTMRVNQRYFALSQEDGSAAPWFGVVANIEATDGGATLIAGNERVLRARLSDARFFWDQDRKQKLEDFLPKLDGVVFHAKLGTQGQRVQRLERLARFIAPMVGADPDLAARAALLAKADLASGMVGEFPELQGVMGRYYALHGGEPREVADAIGQQYRPLGPGDAVPSEPVAVAVALADKLDMLSGFFAVKEQPTGSGDPFALRRAALGVIRTVRENRLRLPLAPILIRSAAETLTQIYYDAMIRRQEQVEELAHAGVPDNWVEDLGIRVSGSVKAFDAESLAYEALSGSDWHYAALVRGVCDELLDFFADRLRVQLRAEGARHDVAAAAFGAGGEDDLLRLLARADALKVLVESDTGANLLTAYRRAANILRIEEKKDGPHTGPVDTGLLAAPEEQALAAALNVAELAVRDALAKEDFPAATAALAALRTPVDAFFDHVTVNDPRPELRANRLRLLSRLRGAMDAVADFSKIEG